MTLGRRWPLPEKHLQYAFPSVALGGLEAGIDAEAIAKSIGKQGGELALVTMVALFRRFINLHGFAPTLFDTDDDRLATSPPGASASARAPPPLTVRW